MKAAFALVVLAVAGTATAASVAAPRPVTMKQIPPEYRGEFSMRAKWCGTDGDDEKRVFVTADTVAMYEAEREVAKVTRSPRGLKITFKPWGKEYYEAGFNPEEGLQPPDELVLTQNGQVLNRIYRRCPAKRKH